MFHNVLPSILVIFFNLLTFGNYKVEFTIWCAIICPLLFFYATPGINFITPNTDTCHPSPFDPSSSWWWPKCSSSLSGIYTMVYNISPYHTFVWTCICYSLLFCQKQNTFQLLAPLMEVEGLSLLLSKQYFASDRRFVLSFPTYLFSNLMFYLKVTFPVCFCPQFRLWGLH